jgi:probable rRNA maturation factor
MAFSVEVQVDPAFTTQVDARQVRGVVCEVLSRAGELDLAQQSARRTGEVRSGAMSSSELTVVIADDDRVRELNRRYREMNSITDVLAFGGASEGFVEAPGATSYLGDVVISYPRVLAQAKERGQSPDEELALLVTHGVLHLLGHDHSTPQGEAIMLAQQQAILRRVGLCWPAAGLVPDPESGN